MEASPILREIGEEEGQSDRPGQEREMGTQVSLAFCGGWGWRNGTDGGLKSSICLQFLEEAWYLEKIF